MRQRRGSLGEVQDSKVARIDAFENVRVNPPEPSPKPGDLDWGQSREEGGARGGVFFCGRLRLAVILPASGDVDLLLGTTWRTSLASKMRRVAFLLLVCCGFPKNGELETKILSRVSGSMQ